MVGCVIIIRDAKWTRSIKTRFPKVEEDGCLDFLAISVSWVLALLWPVIFAVVAALFVVGAVIVVITAPFQFCCGNNHKTCCGFSLGGQAPKSPEPKIAAPKADIDLESQVAGHCDKPPTEP